MPYPVKIAICEDLEEDAAHLLALIKETGINAEVARFENGEDLLAALPSLGGAAGANTGFDLIFLDVYMKCLTGIETARLLRAHGVNSRIVFTTTSRDFSLDAFDVGAEQYLVKPLKRDGRLEKILTKHLRPPQPVLCPINVNGDIVPVPVDDILYVEVENHNCLIHTTTQLYATGRSMTLSSFHQALRPPRFVRSHRSYIVNLSYVKSIGRDFKMKNGDTVYIRRGDVPAVREAYMNWLLDEAGREHE